MSFRPIPRKLGVLGKYRVGCVIFFGIENDWDAH